jgi:hypothetical protein
MLKNAKPEIRQDEKTVCDVLGGWFQKWFHNTPGISDNPVVINKLLQAKDDLTAILRAEVTKKED